MWPIRLHRSSLPVPVVSGNVREVAEGVSGSSVRSARWRLSGTAGTFTACARNVEFAARLCIRANPLFEGALVSPSAGAT